LKCGQSQPRFFRYFFGFRDPQPKAIKTRSIISNQRLGVRNPMRCQGKRAGVRATFAPHLSHALRILFHIGQYLLLLRETFMRPERLSLYWSRTLEEMDLLGVKSLGIVALLSAFMGAVITIQTKTNIDSPLIQAWVVGFATRQSTILEFSPTVISLILAGKVGSSIAAEIGSMRVKEQIDALDIMGVNSAGYLILPKIVATMVINPFLVMISMFLGIFSGWFAGVQTGIVQSDDFLTGIQLDFKVYHVVYALIKTVVFAFLIATVSAYQGYYTRGGTREVGVSSTRAVVFSSMAILLANLILTQMLLL
jgi:phospholipid/cholesterol/gamma-HCH transport system permease protein